VVPVAGGEAGGLPRLGLALLLALVAPVSDSASSGGVGGEAGATAGCKVQMARGG
jgi:hypothetical protein